MKKIQENEFSMGSAGNTGAVNYAAGWGTHSSPTVSQNPSNFSKTGNPNIQNTNVSPSSETLTQTGSFDKDINYIYSKSNSPHPDEILMGLKYELGKMTKKDKFKAKQIVLNNLKKDPHFYGSLRMWNIDDEKMMNTTDSPNKINDKNLHLQVPLTPMEERIKILDEMIKQRYKKEEPSDIIKLALQDTKNRSFR
jgi:hypothetical protein